MILENYGQFSLSHKHELYSERHPVPRKTRDILSAMGERVGNNDWNNVGGRTGGKNHESKRGGICSGAEVGAGTQAAVPMAQWLTGLGRKVWHSRFNSGWGSTERLPLQRYSSCPIFCRDLDTYFVSHVSETIGPPPLTLCEYCYRRNKRYFYFKTVNALQKLQYQQPVLCLFSPVNIKTYLLYEMSQRY